MFAEAGKEGDTSGLAKRKEKGGLTYETEVGRLRNESGRIVRRVRFWYNRIADKP